MCWMEHRAAVSNPLWMRRSDCVCVCVCVIPYNLAWVWTCLFPFPAALPLCLSAFRRQMNDKNVKHFQSWTRPSTALQQTSDGCYAVFGDPSDSVTCGVGKKHSDLSLKWESVHKQHFYKSVTAWFSAKLVATFTLVLKANLVVVVVITNLYLSMILTAGLYIVILICLLLLQ